MRDSRIGIHMLGLTL